MPLDTTRGLPTFQEMYQAYKNKGSLGDAINAGFHGYKQGVELGLDERLQAGKTAEDTAHAVLYRAQAEQAAEDLKDPKIPLILVEEKLRPQLLDYADSQGRIPKSVWLAAQGRGKAETDAAALEEKAKHNEEMATAAQQIADLKALLGPQAQALDAAKTMVHETRDPHPALGGKLQGKISDALGMPSLMPPEEQRYRMHQKAVEELKKFQTPSVPAKPSTKLVPKAPPKTGPGSSQAMPVPVPTQEEYDKWPTGTWMVDSDGDIIQKGTKGVKGKQPKVK